MTINEIMEAIIGAAIEASPLRDSICRRVSGLEE